MAESCNNIKDYFIELQAKLPDFRDNRGKKHNLAFVVLSFFISILRSPGKLNYSLIHRNIIRDSDFLKIKLDQDSCSTISYSQFKRILSKIDYASFNSINENYFKMKIVFDDSNWQAIDGKELRGTIDAIAGQKRSENIIQQVSHQTKESQLIGFYNGSKESEKTIVQKFIEEQPDLQGKAFSFDALHTSSHFLETISEKNGIYLAQIKENQKLLLKELIHTHNNLHAKFHNSTTEKAHGRIETRKGFVYPLNVECLDERWKNSGIRTLLVLERSRYVLKTKIETKETAYFVSNKITNTESSLELFNAARAHWAIESDNYIRDVNFGEDQIKCFEKNTSRMMALAISLALNLLRKLNINNNIRALREDISCNINLISNCFTSS